MNVNYFLKMLKSEYSSILDDNFDAKIYELETLEIASETISKGEDKKINIAIALSYLKIILEMKRIEESSYFPKTPKRRKLMILASFLMNCAAIYL